MKYVLWYTGLLGNEWAKPVGEFPTRKLAEEYAARFDWTYSHFVIERIVETIH